MKFVQTLAMSLAMLVSSGVGAQWNPELLPAPPEAQGCVPQCRDGYICHEGSCISACNPPCEQGQSCTAQGQCVAAAAPYYVAPAPVYPADPYLARQAYRDARRDARAAAKAQRAAEREARRAELRENAYVGRFYAAAHITFQGRGLTDGWNGDYFGNLNLSHSVGTQLGFELGYEARMGMTFGIGPGLRYQRITYRSTDVLDFTVNPTFHVAFDMFELVFPISAGFSMVWDERSYQGDGPFDTDGIGLTAGFMPGVIFWPTRAFGIYANVGLIGHLLAVGYENRFYTTAGNFGVTFAY